MSRLEVLERFLDGGRDQGIGDVTGISFRVVQDGEPDLPIISVQHEGRRSGGLTVYHEHKHLAVAIISAVMRTGAVRAGSARILQVESLQGSQAPSREGAPEARQRLITGTVDGRNARECAHADLMGYEAHSRSKRQTAEAPANLSASRQDSLLRGAQVGAAEAAASRPIVRNEGRVAMGKSLPERIEPRDGFKGGSNGTWGGDSNGVAESPMPTLPKCRKGHIALKHGRLSSLIDIQFGK